MKRLLALVLLLALVGVAQGTNLNFQNPTDLSSITTYTTGVCSGTASWIESATGGNNYMRFTSCYSNYNTAGTYIRLKSPYQMTYAAGTYTRLNGNADVYPSIQLLDANGGVLYTYGATDFVEGKFEVKLVGGKAYIDLDGTTIATSGNLNQNPSYIGFGIITYIGLSTDNTRSWDDVVWGQTENKVVLGLPESDEEVYVVLDDILNDASDGLYNVTHGQVQSTYMTGTWSRGNASIAAGAQPNETIQLVNYYTKTVYAENYTGTGYHGTVQIDIKTLLIDAGAPDGLYALYIPGSGKYSNLIWKKSNGASVHWSSKSYSTGDTGSVITVVADGGYWDTSSYSYSLAVQDVYGVAHGANTSITTQTQTVTHVWDADTDDAGVYYAVLYATSLSTGKQYVLGFDYTTLTTKYQIEGYVNADMTAQPISGAFLNWTQGTSMTNTTSNASGYYHTDPIFITGSVISGNISASGYDTYWWNGTVMLAGSKIINITLSTNPHTFTGIGLGGVDRDSLYHRPLSAAYIRVYNTTYGEEWNLQTNNVGFWWIDEAATPVGYDYLGPGGGASAGRDGNGPSATLNPHVQAVLTDGRLYCAEAYKIGYSNTTECRVVTGA